MDATRKKTGQGVCHKQLAYKIEENLVCRKDERLRTFLEHEVFFEKSCFQELVGI